jgi:4-hydroxybenzoate polyprenyltransferase
MAYIEQLRPKNWLKNIFVFVPLVFSLELTNGRQVLVCAVAFAAFCALSSSVYIFNDLFDLDNDRLHPVKCQRPIASGAISKRKARVFCFAVLALGLALASVINLLTAAVAVAYLTINVAYTLYLKRIPIFDCFCIAAGFLLRIYAGSTASGHAVSDWLFLTIVAMSLFMAYGKRRGELLKFADGETRDVIPLYNLTFLNGMVFVCAGLAVVFYSLWAMVRGVNMIYTVPIVIFLVCRYLLLVHDENSHGDPTSVIVGDKTMLAAVAAYVLTTIVLLYIC